MMMIVSSTTREKGEPGKGKGAGQCAGHGKKKNYDDEYESYE
jgi:hypothetical protein